MKFNFFEELKELASKPRAVYFDYVLWLDYAIEMARDAIDGEQERPGETTPEQNITMFLSEQNLFNPGTFDKNILIKTGEQIIEELLSDLKIYANEHNTSIAEMVAEFSSNQITFLPSTCNLLLTKLISTHVM